MNHPNMLISIHLINVDVKLVSLGSGYRAGFNLSKMHDGTLPKYQFYRSDQNA